MAIYTAFLLVIFGIRTEVETLSELRPNAFISVSFRTLADKHPFLKKGNGLGSAVPNFTLPIALHSYIVKHSAKVFTIHHTEGTSTVPSYVNRACIIYGLDRSFTAWYEFCIVWVIHTDKFNPCSGRIPFAEAFQCCIRYVKHYPTSLLFG